MAAKPTLDRVRWAETAGGTPAAGMTEPTSGKKDTGWAVGELPPRETFNWWEHEAYLWFKYLSDGALTGDHSIGGQFSVTGNTILEKAAATDSSLLVARDNFGNVRATIDHLGLPGGQISEWIEDWRGSGTTAPYGWTFTTSGGAAATLSDPTATLPFRRLALTTAAASGAVEAKSNPLFSCGVDTVAVYEQTIRTGAAIDSGTSIFWLVGLKFGGIECRFLLNPDSNANIQTDLDGSGVASSVAIAVDTTYRLRIEIIGDNMHAGSNTLVKFFINGTLIRSTTNANVAGQNANYETDFDNGAGSSVYTGHIGPARVTWAQRPSADAL